MPGPSPPPRPPDMEVPPSVVNVSVGGVSSNRRCLSYFVVESLGDRVLITRGVADE